MGDERKTKAQLLRELRILRAKVKKLEKSLKQGISIEGSLREGEALYRELFEAESDSIFLIDNATGNIQEANSAAATLYGYTTDEFLSMRDVDLSAESEKVHYVTRGATITAGQVVTIPLRYHRKKDGTVFPVEITGRFFNRHGHLVRVAAIRDITERKRAEELLKQGEKRYELLFESSPVAINITRGTDITYANRSYLTMFGFSSTDELKLVEPLKLFAPEWHAKIRENIALRAKGVSVPESYEVECVRKDGTKFPVLMYLTRMMFADGLATVGFIIDITERKRAELLLKRYQLLSENTRDIVLFVRARDGRILEANAAASQAYGYDREELMSKTIRDLRAPETVRDVEEQMSQAIRNGMLFETQHRRRDGTVFPVEVNAQGMTIGEDEILLSVVRDIAERKRSQDALRESQARLDLALRSANMGVWYMDLIENKRHFDDQVCQLLGINPKTFAGTSEEFFGTVHLDDQETIKAALARTIGQGVPYEPEYRVVWPDGSVHDIAARGRLVRDERDLPVRINGIIWDVTERKRAEEALRNSEDKFRKAFMTSPDAVTINRLNDGLYVSVNTGFTRLMGYSAEDILGKTSVETNIWDDLGDRNKLVEGLKKDGIVENLAAGFRSKNGEIKYGMISASIIELDGIQHVLGVVRDITESRKVEEALTVSEEKYRGIFENVQDVYFETSIEGTIIEVSPSIDILSRRQYRRHDLIGNSMYDFYSDPGERQTLLMSLQARGRVTDFEITLKNSDGSQVPCSISAKIEFDAHGAPWKIIGSMRDITERKRAEQALRESEERFRALFEQAAVGVALLETKTGRYVQINQRYCDFLGYSMEEMLHKTLHDVTHPDDTQTNLDGSASLIAGTTREFSLEKRYFRKDGTLVWGNLTASPLWKPGEQPDAYFHIAVVEDITERKQMEEELRKSETRFRTLIEQSPVAVSLSREGKGMYANTKLMQLFGLGSAEEYSGSTVTEYFAPRAREASRERTQQRAHGLSSASEYESVLARKDGSEFPVHITVTTVELADGPANMAFITDITERKRAEEALRESEGRLRDITFSMADWVWEVDKSGVYTYSSQKGFDLFGPAYDDVIGKSPFDLMPQDEAKRVGAIFSEIAANKLPIKDFEYWNISRTGERICLLTNGVPILDEQGNLKGYRGVDKDITERKRAEDELRASESRFRDLWGATVEGLTILDGGTIVEVNDAICRMFGTTREQAVGKSFLSFAPPEMHESLRRRVTSGTEGRFETPALRADGATITLEVFTKRFIYHGKPMRMAAMRDMTERKRADEALKKERSLLSTIIETIPDEICLKDTDSRYIMANKASVTALGAKSLEEMLGKTDLEYVRRDIALRLLAEEKQILESGKPMIAREVARVDPKTGEISKCDLYTKVPVKAQDGTTVGLLVINMDITQRKRAEENVKRSELRLRQLSAHLESVREEERKHIAQEFHDQLGQTLTALKMDLSLMERSIADEKKEISRAALIEEMHSSQKLIDRGIQTVRTIMSELRPELLDQLGLVEALEWEVGKFQQRSGVVCGLTADVGDLQLDARRSIALFRLVQEALTNVSRHAQATRVDIGLRIEGDDLVLEVKDDGIGISFDAESKPRSFGLIGMRERAVFLGGNLEITGTVGKGTTIVVRMPIHETLPDGGGGYKRDLKGDKY